MGAYEFRLLEHNFDPARPDVNEQTGSRSDLNRLSVEGWWVEAATVAFPYVHILWKRPVDGPDAAPAAADTAALEEIRTRLAQAEEERDQALADAKAHVEERNAAVRERDHANQQAAQLRQQLAVAQQPPSSAT
jgi:hypothetical protein